MRPGIAANADSVNRLAQRLLDLRVTYASRTGPSIANSPS
jgi:hypothetical protein